MDKNNATIEVKEQETNEFIASTLRWVSKDHDDIESVFYVNGGYRTPPKFGEG